MSRPAGASGTRAVPAIANAGSLSRIALPEVLKNIALREASGCLEVSSGSRVRTIYFDRGFIVFTASNSDEDRLGRCLLDAGRITEKELEVAAELMKKKKRRIGEAIVAAGYLTQEELGRELANQARKIATSLFAVVDGTYRFSQQACPIPLELRLGLSLYRIQLEGIRLMRNGELIRSGLPRPQALLRCSKCPPFSFEEVRFLPVEILAMEAAQRERSLEAIVGRVGMKPGTVLRAIYGLLSAGILELAEGAEKRQPLKVQEEMGTFLLSQVDRTGAPLPEAQNVRQEVLLEFENSERASAEELLAVPSGAGPEEVEKAYQERRSAWQEKQGKLENEKTLFLKVEEIQRRLALAKEKLLQQEKPSEGAQAEPAPEPKTPARPSIEAAAAELKRLLREVKLRKMVRDDEGTISLLYEVVALAPANAKYEAMLAQALASHPVMKSKAERHFRRALSLDPQNAEVHYLLGRYYQSFEMKSRAYAEFKAALTINPALSPARSALVELKGQENFQDRIKRLFA